MPRDLTALPKAHLHLHLEAGMSPKLLAELSAKYDREVPVVRGYGTFGVFSSMYQAATDVLREREDWVALADDVLAQQAADGAVYVEPAFWAGNFRHRFASDEACWDLVFEVFSDAVARHGVALGWMVAADRVLDTPDEAIELASFAVARRDDGVVSFGLHNDEVGHPAIDYAPAFDVARDGGLMLTPHAGELEGAHHVVEAIELLRADRIQHGVRAVEQDGLIERLAELGTCLDVCPTSNVMLSVVPSIEDHPLPRLLAAGVLCSVNADDPLLFGPGLLDEYELCRTTFGFDDATMAGIARTSIECGGAPDAVKAAALAGIDAWLGCAP